MRERMPALFLGHGNPMNAISNNAYTEGWRTLGRSIPRPRAIVCVSAHWYVPYGAVTVTEKPETIHDFGGFPEALYQVEYPAPGNPGLARQVKKLLAPIDIQLNDFWGLDHGAWSILIHLFPDADIPVIQLAINRTEPAAFHYDMGKRLASLRDEGILVMGSGNIVHNLREYDWGNPTAPAFDWAARFEQTVKESIRNGDDEKIVSYTGLGEDAMRSVPTPDHYLPLLYILGVRQPGEPVGFPVEGVDGRAVSMLAVQVG